MQGTPTLILNGDLDAQTPVWSAQAQTDHMQRPPGGSRVVFEKILNAAHGTAFRSPVKTAGAGPCGFQMLLSLLRNPDKPIDESCKSDLLPLDFSVSADYARAYLGVSDAYDGTLPTPTPSPTCPPPPASQESSEYVSAATFWGVAAPLVALALGLGAYNVFTALRRSSSSVRNKAMMQQLLETARA